MLVDGAVQVAPLAADLDVGFVDPDRAAMTLTELAQPLLDQRRVGEHPAVQGGVVDRDCQEFRVRAAIVDPKEVPDGTTQSTPYP